MKSACSCSSGISAKCTNCSCVYWSILEFMNLLIYQIADAILVGSLKQCSWTPGKLLLFLPHTPWEFRPLDPSHPLKFSETFLPWGLWIISGTTHSDWSPSTLWVLFVILAVIFHERRSRKPKMKWQNIWILFNPIRSGEGECRRWFQPSRTSLLFKQYLRNFATFTKIYWRTRFRENFWEGYKLLPW